MGLRIWNVANGKIGSDTTRLEDGNQVMYNVCAGFVSSVLIESRLLEGYRTCDIEPVFETVAVEGLNGLLGSKSNFVGISSLDWETGLQRGDVVIWGCDGLSICSSKENSDEFQHVTIFDSYATGRNYTVIHDGGRASRISKTIYPGSRDPTGWYVTYVWRAVEEREEIGSGSDEELIEILRREPSSSRLQKAIEIVRSFPQEDEYSDRGVFIDYLCDARHNEFFLTEDECDDIRAEGWTNWGEENMGYVLQLLLR